MPATLSPQHIRLIHQTYPRLVAGRHQLHRALRYACHDVTLDAELTLLRLIATAVATLDASDELDALLDEARHTPLLGKLSQAADPVMLHQRLLADMLSTLGHEHTPASAEAWQQLLRRLLGAVRRVMAQTPAPV